MRVLGMLAAFCVASIGSAANADTYLFSYYSGDTLEGVVAYDQTSNPAPSNDSGVYASVIGSTGGNVYDNARFLSSSFGGGVDRLTSGAGSPTDQQLYVGDRSPNPVFVTGSFDYLTADGQSAGRIVVDDITNKAVNLFVLSGPSQSALILSYDAPSSYTPSADGGFALNNFTGTSFAGNQQNNAKAIVTSSSKRQSALTSRLL